MASYQPLPLGGHGLKAPRANFVRLRGISSRFKVIILLAVCALSYYIFSSGDNRTINPDWSTPLDSPTFEADLDAVEAAAGQSSPRLE